MMVFILCSFSQLPGREWIELVTLKVMFEKIRYVLVCWKFCTGDRPSWAENRSSSECGTFAMGLNLSSVYFFVCLFFVFSLPSKIGHKTISLWDLFIGVYFHQGESSHSYLPDKACLQTSPFLLGVENLILKNEKF